MKYGQGTGRGQWGPPKATATTSVATAEVYCEGRLTFGTWAGRGVKPGRGSTSQRGRCSPYHVPGGPPPLQHLPVAEHPGHQRVRRMGTTSWSRCAGGSSRTGRRGQRPLQHLQRSTGVPRPRSGRACTPQGPGAAQSRYRARLRRALPVPLPRGRGPRLADFEALVARRPRAVMDTAALPAVDVRARPYAHCQTIGYVRTDQAVRGGHCSTEGNDRSGEDTRMRRFTAETLVTPTRSWRGQTCNLSRYYFTKFL